ncbi:hypothetical protein AAG906_005407 [Vitis piasezkii]
MAKSCPISTFFIIISVLSHFTSRIGVDPDAIRMASRDFGKLVPLPNPAAVLYPCSIEDIASLVKFSYNLSSPFSIAARGRGHCHSGQAMAPHGVVVEMRSLNDCSRGSGIRVTKNSILGSYADVGATVKHGLAPVSWTDYLYLTVGGVLSNGGISGQTFRRGPPISNVYEMDVLTDTNSELFFAVLGGLGQFGIITRARIVLEPAPKRVKWIHMLYHDFSAFSRDQEHLISINGLDYLEGSLFLHNCPPNNWRSSFSPSDYPRISSLISKKGIIYCLEVVKYYDDLTSHTVDEVHFNKGVFRDILPKINQTTGPIHVYPMIRNKWDDRMVVVTPDEDIFYAIGLLQSSGADDWKPLEENQNKEILQFCDKVGMKHFGPKWKTFENRKAQFDPKMILSPYNEFSIPFRF